MRNTHFKHSIFAAALMGAMTYRNADDGTGAASSTSAAATTSAEGVETNSATNSAPALSEEQKAALHASIKANFNNLVDVKETAFHFRKVKDETSKIETKRPTVTLQLPYPSVEGIVAILEAGGKQLDLLLEAVAGVVQDTARDIVNANEEISDANFPLDKVTWEAIANMPKAERRGGGISKEVWEDFAADYQAIMPAATGKTKEQVELAAKVFLTKFANAKTNKPVLKVLQGQLAVYANTTSRGEEFAACIQFLDNKLETLIATDETSLLANL